MSRVGLFGLALFFLAGGLMLLGSQFSREKNPKPAIETKSLGSEPIKKAADEPAWMTEYTLTERSGRKFNSSQLKGKVHVVNFFFTSCPTACPLQQKKVQELDREFGPQGVMFLSISCDPERDTPVVLKQYADRLHADPNRWLFLTGDFDYIRRVAAEMYWSPLPQRMAHREDLVVVDKWGKVRGNFPWNDSAQIGSLKKLVKELLTETEPPADQAPAAVDTQADDAAADDATAAEERADDSTAEAPANE